MDKCFDGEGDFLIFGSGDHAMNTPPTDANNTGSPTAFALCAIAAPRLSRSLSNLTKKAQKVPVTPVPTSFVLLHIQLTSTKLGFVAV
jgi:hypothetical protein